MAKIDDAEDTIREDSQYVEPEEFFSDPPSEETIEEWTESLTGFDTQTSVSTRAEVDLNAIRQFYSENEVALEQYAATLGIEPIGQSSPKMVLFMVYIRILQSKYTGKQNLNSHKFENVLNKTYDVENNGSEKSTPENEIAKELNPGPLRGIDPAHRDLPESEENISYESRKKNQAEAANTHEQTVETIRTWLETDGWSCKETEETDLLATRAEQVLVIEIKSIDGQNDSRQIRKGLGQLLENCYRDVVQRGWDDRTAIAILVLSQQPKDQYLGYFEHLRRRNIETLWIESDEVKGLPESIGRVS